MLCLFNFLNFLVFLSDAHPGRSQDGPRAWFSPEQSSLCDWLARKLQSEQVKGNSISPFVTQGGSRGNGFALEQGKREAGRGLETCVLKPPHRPPKREPPDRGHRFSIQCTGAHTLSPLSPRSLLTRKAVADHRRKKRKEGDSERKPDSRVT